MSELEQRFNSIMWLVSKILNSLLSFSVTIQARPNHFHSQLLSDDLSYNNTGEASVKLLEEAPTTTTTTTVHTLRRTLIHTHGIRLKVALSCSSQRWNVKYSTQTCHISCNTDDWRKPKIIRELEECVSNRNQYKSEQRNEKIWGWREREWKQPFSGRVSFAVRVSLFPHSVWCFLKWLFSRLRRLCVILELSFATFHMRKAASGYSQHSVVLRYCDFQFVTCCMRIRWWSVIMTPSVGYK